jgi:hypothetical protein
MPKSFLPPRWYTDLDVSQEEIAELNKLAQVLQNQGSTPPPPDLLPRLLAKLPPQRKHLSPLIYAGAIALWLFAFWLIGQPSVLLKWQPIQEAERFRVYRLINHQPVLLAEISQPTYQDLGVLPGLEIYQVEALNATGQTIYTEQISISTWKPWLGGLVAALFGLLTVWATENNPSLFFFVST